MKIAILIAGQLRTFNEVLVYSSFVNHLLVPIRETPKNEIQVFFCLGILNETPAFSEEEITINEEAIKEIERITQNKYHLFTYNSKTTERFPYGQINQLIGIQKGFEYIFKNWNPDILIRTRPDFVCLNPFKFEECMDDNHLYCLIKSDTPHKAHDCFFYMTKTFYINEWEKRAKNHINTGFDINDCLEYCFLNKKFERRQIKIINTSVFKGGLKRKDQDELAIWE